MAANVPDRERAATHSRGCHDRQPAPNPRWRFSHRHTTISRRRSGHNGLRACVECEYICDVLARVLLRQSIVPAWQ
jgi:hypothetical protein